MAGSEAGGRVSAEAHAIDTRRAVHDKFSDVIEDLSLAAHVGNRRYGDQPRLALERLRVCDDAFHTSISDELRAIETHLRRQRLEQQWREQTGVAATPEQSPRDTNDAMNAWVEEQLARGGGEVNCTLPPREQRSLTPRRAESKMAKEGTCKNPKYEDAVHTRGQGTINVLDRVALGGREGTVLRIRGEKCTLAWADDGAEDTVELRNCSLIQKAHPALLVTHTTSAVPLSARRSRSGTPRRSETPSRLAALFSKQGEPGVPPPDFLQPPPREENRKLMVQLAQQEKTAKLPVARDPSASPRRTRSRNRPPATAKFMEVHKPTGPQERVVKKRPGEIVGLSFEPETLCISDHIGFGPALEQLSDLRRMRVTHVAPHERGFTEADATHTAAALRQRLAKCQAGAVCAIRVVPWSQRRAVEKKRREFQDKVSAARGETPRRDSSHSKPAPEPAAVSPVPKAAGARAAGRKNEAGAPKPAAKSAPAPVKAKPSGRAAGATPRK